jgi:iron complex transport system substrate-binding protein
MNKMQKIHRVRVLISLSLLALGLMIFGGCGQNNNGNAESEGIYTPVAEYEADATPEPESLGPAGHILVTDFLGREVWVPQNPQYIASIYAPTAHLVAMLGGADNIVAMANGNTRDVLFMEIFPQLSEVRLPRGGGIDVNVEELFADPVPQLILLDAVSVSDDRILSNLELFGVPVLAIEYFSIDGLKTMVSMLGEILGAQQRAAAFIDYFADTINMIQERIGDMPQEDKKVVYHAVNEILRTNITNSLPGEWMPMVGMIPAIYAQSDDPIGVDRLIISLEQLLIYDPDYIIITGADVYDYIHSDRGERLQVLSAYRYNRIFLLPMGITRWAHQNSLETPLAMKWLAQTLHPELFADIDMHQAIIDFYRDFFDYDISDEFVEMILDGRTFRDWRAFRRD